MAVTNQGMGNPPLRQTPTPISDSTTNHTAKLIAEGMGLSTILAQTIGVLTQDGSCGCSCCKVMVVCTSKGQGAGCERTITAPTINTRKPSIQRAIATSLRICALRCPKSPASVEPSRVCLPSTSVGSSIVL